MIENSESPRDMRARVANATEDAIALPRLGLGRGKDALRTERRRRAEYFLERLTAEGSVPAWVNETFVSGVFHITKPEAGAMLAKARGK